MLRKRVSSSCNCPVNAIPLDKWVNIGVQSVQTDDHKNELVVNMLPTCPYKDKPNFCIIYSTLFGKMAYGGRFVKLFGDVLAENEPGADLLSTIRKVNQRLSKGPGGQESILWSNLNRILLLTRREASFIVNKVDSKYP